MQDNLPLEAKILAWYSKLKTDDKGPVYRMVMTPILKEMEEYFGIKVSKNVSDSKGKS